MIHGYDRDGGSAGDVQRRKVAGQIGRPFASTELDDRNTLPMPRSRWKLVKGGDLQRREGRAFCLLGVPSCVAAKLAYSKMRLGRRAIVQSEDRFDDAVELVRKLDAPDASTVRAAWMLETLKVDVEGGVELRDGSRQNDRTAAGMLLHDRESARVREFCDRVLSAA